MYKLFRLWFFLSLFCLAISYAMASQKEFNGQDSVATNNLIAPIKNHSYE